MDEQELIAAARLGDQDAFAKLYQLHVAYVRGVGRSVLRTKDVDDLCQDAFLLAFTRLHSFAGNSQFRTWITRITINQCLVTLRKERRSCDSECHLTDEWTFPVIDKVLEEVPTRLDLDRLLDGLRPATRRILEMAYLENIPDQEIAEMLGITLAAAKSKIYHAKQRARKMHKKR